MTIQKKWLHVLTFSNLSLVRCHQKYSCQKIQMATVFLKKEEMKNLGKYVVTLFGKADDFSYLSNLTFWKLISFYVKDYLKQESIKIPIYLFYLTFHNMLIDKKNFCISKCILYFTSHTSNKVWHSCGAYWIIWSPVFGKDTGSNSCKKVWQEVVKFWSTYWGWQQNCSPDR